MKKIIRYVAILSIIASFIPVRQPQAAEPAISIQVDRPAGKEPFIDIRVYKEYGKLRVPVNRAEVIIKGPGGFSKAVITNATGTAVFDPIAAFPATGKQPERMEFRIEVRVGSRSTGQGITITREEMDFYLKQAADKLTDEGNRLAKDGKLREALRLYQKALDLDPLSERASSNIALAYEILGSYHLAVSSYSGYLFMHPAATDRQKIKMKVIRLSKKMTPAPLIPREALDLFSQGTDAVEGRNYMKGMGYYEAAQSLAPFWPEPYYSAGLLCEHLAYQNNFGNFSETALLNFTLFLEAADPDDPRIDDVKKRVEDIRQIREGLKAPKYINVR